MIVDKDFLSNERNGLTAQIQRLQKGLLDHEHALKRGEGALQIIDMLLYRLSQDDIPEVSMTEQEFAEALAKGAEVESEAQKAAA